MALNTSQLASITHRLLLPKAVDAIFDSNPLMFRFRKKGIKYSGGRQIVQPLVYQKVDAAGWYSGYDPLSTTPNDVLTAAVFEWRQAYAHISMSGEEKLKNSGKAAILSLLEAKRQAMSLTLEDKIGTGIQGSGGSDDIDGLGALFNTTTSTAYGDIAEDDLATWNARTHTLATTGTLALLDMQKAMGSATIGADAPTVIVTRQSVFDKFWSLLQPDQRFNSDKGMAGFQTLQFNGRPVVVDSHVSGTDGGTQDNWMEFLNEKYLWLAIHKDANFKVVPIPVHKDQDASHVRILWAGNLLCSNRRMHNVIKTVDPNL